MLTSLATNGKIGGTVVRVTSCEECGFDFETLEAADVGPRIRRGVEAVASALSNSWAPDRRPAVERWSANESAAHVRDVLISIRDRLVVGLVEDNPGFKPLYRDERLAMGLYLADSVAELTAEIRATGPMFVRLFEAIAPAQLSREVQYGFPDPETRTLLWMGRQAVHETEHHLLDINANNTLFAGHSPTGRQPEEFAGVVTYELRSVRLRE